MQAFEVTEILIGEVFLNETCRRPDVFAAGNSPKIGRHQSRSSFPASGMKRFQKRQGVQAMSSIDYHGQKRSANKSLERTPNEQGCFASPAVCGRRSALRWAHLQAKDRVLQMSDFESHDSDILGSSIPVAVGQCGSECRLLIPKSSFGA